MGNPRTLTLLPPQKSKRHNWFPFWSFQEAPLNPRRRTEVFTPHTLVFPRGTPFPPRERRRAWLALLAQRHDAILTGGGGCDISVSGADMVVARHHARDCWFRLLRFKQSPGAGSQRQVRKRPPRERSLRDSRVELA